MLKKILSLNFLALALIISSTVGYAVNYVLNYSFSPGSMIKSSEVNSNFTGLTQAVNERRSIIVSAYYSKTYTAVEPITYSAYDYQSFTCDDGSSTFSLSCKQNFPAAEGKIQCTIGSGATCDYTGTLTSGGSLSFLSSSSGGACPNNCSGPGTTSVTTSPALPTYKLNYDVIAINKNSSYNPTTQVFTAPADGIYTFSANHLCDPMDSPSATPNQYARASMVSIVPTSSTMNIFNIYGKEIAISDRSHDMNPGGVRIRLSSGDQIYIVVSDLGSDYYCRVATDSSAFNYLTIEQL